MCDVINPNNERRKSLSLNSFLEVYPIIAFIVARIKIVKTKYAQ
jgi:hypothetical protein